MTIQTLFLFTALFFGYLTGDLIIIIYYICKKVQSADAPGLAYLIIRIISITKLILCSSLFFLSSTS